MSDRIHHNPPAKVWVCPSDPADLAPLPGLLRSCTEHEIIVCEYDRRSKTFKPERERRTTAYAHFDECRIAMLQDQCLVLEKAKEEARNQASIYQHILSLPPAPWPHEAIPQEQQAQAEEQGQQEAVQEEVIEPAKEKPAAPLKRPSRRS